MNFELNVGGAESLALTLLQDLSPQGVKAVGHPVDFELFFLEAPLNLLARLD